MAESTPAPGRTLARHDAGYETARRDTVWRTNMPDRFPDRIVQASSVSDVVAAVRAAKAEGRQVGVRSGGHSWSANHVRDGGVLIDVSRLKGFTVDKSAMTATAEPGLGGSVLLAELMKRDLFFPVGHCRGVAIGGYLLQGGFGWNGRAFGIACSNVIAIDYVDADGELRHASETENTDMLWAARGSGPDFFGVVVRFHLRVYPKPGFIGTSIITYPVERLSDLVRWVDRIGPSVPPGVEMQFVISRSASVPPPLRRRTVHSPVSIELATTVMADSRSAAKAATAYMAGAPKGARLRIPLLPMSMPMMYSGVMQHYPEANWETDNLWTHAGADELLPHIQRIADTLPAPPAHFLWLNWAPTMDLPDMAYTVEDRTYLAFYGGWLDGDDGAATTRWSRDNAAAMESLSTGVQFADDPGRPSRGISEAAQRRLEAIRAVHDPEGRFNRWIGAVSA
ncbi:MAG: FAD-binding oxidoreductase [Mycobacterium sp.]|nr:FAD-binding oxidoreductase [Mycobacterium sp.]